jgi:hypothetical protein
MEALLISSNFKKFSSLIINLIDRDDGNKTFTTQQTMA